MRVEGAVLILLALCGCGLAQSQVHYVVSLANPDQHLVEVTMEVPPGPGSHDLQLPVWNALSQVRDFSQYMNWIKAFDAHGRDLSVRQLNKSRWSIEGAQDGARVEYQIVADLPGPYGAEVNARHAFFNLAEILIYADDLRGSPARLEFRGVPPGWRIATTLRQRGAEYSADSYDQLVDSPVEIGGFQEADFAADCGKYRIIVDSQEASQIFPRIQPAIQRIVAAASVWMKACPFETYTFVYHFPDSPVGGGMEHARSTAISVPLKTLSENFDAFTSVTAHEFFHLWNVKRIRPQSLEPVDYTRENYSRALWFSEGVDSTVADLIRLRAGVLDEFRYLQQLGEQITELQNRPAHLTQSAEQSSLDAWLEKYPHYGLPQRSISYYNKGELLGVLLDLKIREATDDRQSLRDLFLSMNEHYAKQGRYFEESEAVRNAAEATAHTDLKDFFSQYVAGTREIPWDTFFARVGLRVAKSVIAYPDPGFDTVHGIDQPPTVVMVYSGSEAERAGLLPGDVITAVDGQPATGDFEKQIARLSPGQVLRLTIRRDGLQRQLSFRPRSSTRAVYRLEEVSGATSEQKSRRHKWLFDGAAP
jgi:predicted metalloprotease with PDZ domain